MKRILLIAACALCICTACNKGGHSPSVNMEGRKANCEYPILTFKMADGATKEININGLPVREFYGAELICQPCDNPANWRVVARRGVAFSDIFAAAEINASDNTPISMIGRDGFDVLRQRLGGDTSKVPNFGYLANYAYIYVGSPGFRDPSNASTETAKDPLYPEMEGKSLCIDFNHDTVIGAAEQAGAMGVDTSFDTCFGSFRTSMLEKYNDSLFGLIEIDPQ
jgi:hypothetical protein